MAPRLERDTLSDIFNLDGILKLVFLVAWLVAALLMLGLGIVGFLEVWRGILESLTTSSANLHAPHEMSVTADALGSVLEGFEYLLLAPIPLAVVVVISRYTAAFLAHDPRAARQAGDAGEMEARHAKALHQYHLVKRLILSLMISVVATDLIKRFLGNQLEEQKTSLIGVLFGGGLFVLLTAYLLVRTKLDQHE